MTKERKLKLALHDRLSHLGLREVAGLLGDQGERLIREGGGRYEIDPVTQVILDSHQLRLSLPDAAVSIGLSAAKPGTLTWHCSRCRETCVHVGAAFSLILEEKMALGLAAPPPEKAPFETLDDSELVQRALDERAERARTERMTVRALEPSALWTDYIVTSGESGKTYRVALRGWEPGDSYCSCPDFRKNTLGTCKHILHTIAKMKRSFPAGVRRRPHVQDVPAVHLRYGPTVELRLLLPERLAPAVAEAVAPLRGVAITDVHDLVQRLSRLEALGTPVTVYPDAEEFIQQRLHADRIAAKMAEIRRDPANHPLRRELLKTELLPYQLDGIAFAVGAGRAILADDMGLGKTIQGIGVAELLAHEAGIGRVLIVCPVSLKAQWRSEIQRFSDRPCALVAGTAEERADQYAAGPFFTVCNYEQVLRDILAIEKVRWDLIVLDEGQRIKNWEAKTSRIVKGLRSPFALVLSGTPLENRLDELFSVVEFIDERRLGPAFRFFHHHRVTDERGKVLGYRNLDDLREALRPVLLRRTRATVARDLPPRTTEIVRITPTGEQLEMHDAHLRLVSAIVRKPYLTEMDLLRLQKELLMCRLAANGTLLVDKQEPNHSSKLEELDHLLGELAGEEGRKVILFSEWTTMLDLIEPLLRKHGLEFVRLDGSVPQKQRPVLVHRFQTQAACRFFITTNAGATGLNLQAANTVINVDLPWNPALLEQRISRAHRMGQRQPVQVFLLVTEGTLEKRLLGTLSAKHELALAALDADSDVERVDLVSGIEELKRRLEVLLGTKPVAPVDETEKQRQEAQLQATQRQERVAEAGGQLLGAAFAFLGAMMPEQAPSAEREQAVARIRQRLGECLGTDAQGRAQLTVTLPNADALDGLAQALARLLA